MYLIANFKAHQIDIEDYIHKISPYSDSSLKIILSPPFPYLQQARSPFFPLCAQDISQFSDGPFTGEVTGQMLHSLGIEYCLIGHSERREYFLEKSDVLLKKIHQALENNLQPIICVGETKAEHDSGSYLKVIDKQVKEIVVDSAFTPIIAYEPIWAIGSGKTPSHESIQEVIDAIKQHHPTANVLYGGSVNSENAKSLSKHTDGLLVGSASKDVNKFIQIIQQLEAL